MNRSGLLFEEAKQYIPGGVNSPVRACNSVGGHPRFMERAKGCYITDVDGTSYIDYIGSWGPMILGHSFPAIQEAVIKAVPKGLSFGANSQNEVQLAKLICELVPSIDKVRMVNSGTEAVMSAIRVARGYTNREKIVKFIGCYHGHADGMLVAAGSGVMTSGVPDSAGVTKGCAQDTLLVNYNDFEGVEELFKKYGEEIAGVIIEPVAANMGVVLPEPGFLQLLRKLCTEYNSVLIFDEVITGFRLGIDGAQGYYKVLPDLTTFGKIIGAGMPVGAYGGKEEIMNQVSPVGPVYQAGTLSGNPIAMAAGIAQLSYLKENPSIYETLNQRSDYFFQCLEEIVLNSKRKATVNHIGSLGCVFFTQEKVTNYENAKTADTLAFASYYQQMIASGIYLAPSQFEAIFLSAAHGDKEIEETLECMKRYWNH